MEMKPKNEKLSKNEPKMKEAMEMKPKNELEMNRRNEPEMNHRNELEMNNILEMNPNTCIEINLTTLLNFKERYPNSKITILAIGERCNTYEIIGTIHNENKHIGQFKIITWTKTEAQRISAKIRLIGR